MGIKIELPIETLEEANLLDETLAQRIDTLCRMANMREATSAERVLCLAKATVLKTLRERLVSST